MTSDLDMIVSHTHKFVFLKTSKTAGTSIEIALSQYCGSKDIITPISPEDEYTRNRLGFTGPQHYLAPIADYSFADALDSIMRRRLKRRFFNHIAGSEVKKHLGQKNWDSYFTFCFERNPWDRVVSLYFHVHQNEPRPSLSDFVQSDALLILRKRGRDIYTAEGVEIVDRVCRFEDLSKELSIIVETIGLPGRLKLPRAKSRFRKTEKTYQDLLTPQDRDRIADVFSDEIDRFGYDF